MKTKNSVQKAILRSVAVVISFILISFTVSAEDFWRKLIINSSFNEIAIAMVETSKEAKLPATSGKSLASYEVIAEPALELEQWMTDQFYFYHPVFEIRNEVEIPLQLEDWMLNDQHFYPVEVETDEPLELESWMVSDEYWNC
jgi:hypothetical protein